MSTFGGRRARSLISYCGTSGATASAGTGVWYVEPEATDRKVHCGDRRRQGTRRPPGPRRRLERRARQVRAVRERERQRVLRLGRRPGQDHRGDGAGGM